MKDDETVHTEGERGKGDMGKHLLAIVLALCLCLSACCEEVEYIRVVSRDDSIAAQLEKYRVRDAIIPLLKKAGGPLTERLDEINRVANQVAPSQAIIRPWVPEGYTEGATLYITIGEGQGPNWWGILYPDGLDLFSEETGDEGIVFDWPVIQWILQWLGI